PMLIPSKRRPQKETAKGRSPAASSHGSRHNCRHRPPDDHNGQSNKRPYVSFAGLWPDQTAVKIAVVTPRLERFLVGIAGGRLLVDVDAEAGFVIGEQIAPLDLRTAGEHFARCIV